MSEINPKTGEPYNAVRAMWAREAVDVFAENTFNGETFTGTIGEQPNKGDDPYCMIHDLICNCLHLAKMHGWDPKELIDGAYSCFEDEVSMEANA